MSAIPADLVRPSPWRTALPAMLGVLAVLALLYRDTWLAMVEIWERSETFAHAWLVLPITLWLVWRRRAHLASITPQSQPWLLLLLAAAAAAWLVSDLVVVNAATQFAFVFLVILSVPALLGLEVFRALLFPLLFLLFAVPFGEFMVPPMMDWTADFVVLALQWTGVPVYREGLFFVIPSGNWSVIDECSGVRYLMASFMVGTLFAYLNYRSFTKRALFMAVSIVMPIVANWLRAYMIVMLGHLSGNKLAVGVDHILYGWVFFGIVIFAMFMVGMRWADADEPMPAGDRAAGRAEGPWRLWPVAVATAAVLALPHLVVGHLERADSAAQPAQLALPGELPGGWRQAGTPALDWAPTWQRASALQHHWYEGAEGRIGVYVAYYRGQDRERKLVSSTNSVVWVNDRQWNPVGRGERSVEVDGRGVRLASTNILAPEGAGQPRPHVVALRAYWVDGRWVLSDPGAKLANAAARLRGRGDDGAVVVLYASRASFDAAARDVESFARQNLAAIGSVLQRTRDAR